MRRVGFADPARPCETSDGVKILQKQNRNEMKEEELPIIQDSGIGKG